MTTTTNPFQDDPVKAEVFEQGLIAGFNDPDGNNFRPFPEDLLDVFQQGFQVGRGDKGSAPEGNASFMWMSSEDIANLEEGAQEVEQLALTLVLEHLLENPRF